MDDDFSDGELSEGSVRVSFSFEDCDVPGGELSEAACVSFEDNDVSGGELSLGAACVSFEGDFGADGFACSPQPTSNRKIEQTSNHFFTFNSPSQGTIYTNKLYFPNEERL